MFKIEYTLQFPATIVKYKFFSIYFWFIFGIFFIRDLSINKDKAKIIIGCREIARYVLKNQNTLYQGTIEKSSD